MYLFISLSRDSGCIMNFDILICPLQSEDSTTKKWGTMYAPMHTWSLT